MSPPGEVSTEDAEAAFQRVAMLTAAGDLAGARSALRHLGDRADAAGQPVLASRALRLSATLDRALGDPNDAVATARRAAALAEAAATAPGAGPGTYDGQSHGVLRAKTPVDRPPYIEGAAAATGSDTDDGQSHGVLRAKTPLDRPSYMEGRAAAAGPGADDGQSHGVFAPETPPDRPSYIEGAAATGPGTDDGQSDGGLRAKTPPDRPSYMEGGVAEVATAAYAELAESLVVLGRAADAAAAYGIAAGHAGSPATATALRRMQALALTSAGRTAEAAAVLRELAERADDPTAKASLLIQAATTRGTPTAPATGGENSVAAPAGTASPQITDAAQLLREARDAVGAAGAAARDLRTDLAFVAASAALDDRDLPRAMAEIRAARRHALDGVAVLQYIAAAVAESAVAELMGDDRSAYGSLATGYATLGDVVGKGLSAATFEGPLVRLRERWGPPRFARAKRAYEDERRHVGSGR